MFIHIVPFLRRNKEEVLQLLFPSPKGSSKSARPTKSPKVQSKHPSFLPQEYCTLAISKMIKVPPRRKHIRQVSTMSGSNGYFGNMWSEIQHKSMQASTQSNRRGNSKDNPICYKVTDILNGLLQAICTCNASTLEITNHVSVMTNSKTPRVITKSLNHITRSLRSSTASSR